MNEIEDRIEDFSQDAMDIIHRAIGREDAARFSHVFAAMRDVTVASLVQQGFLQGRHRYSTPDRIA